VKFGAEVVKIIEAGIEGDVEKVKEYARQLADKMSCGDHTKRAIMKRLKSKQEEEEKKQEDEKKRTKK